MLWIVTKACSQSLHSGLAIFSVKLNQFLSYCFKSQSNHDGFWKTVHRYITRGTRPGSLTLTFTIKLQQSIIEATVPSGQTLGCSFSSVKQDLSVISTRQDQKFLIISLLIFYLKNSSTRLHKPVSYPPMPLPYQ